MDVKDEKKTKWRRMNRVAFVICALRCIRNENIIILSIISVWRNSTEIFNIQRTERPRSVCVGAIALQECLFELLSLSLSRMMNALDGCFATDYYCFSSSKWVSVCNVSASLQHSCFFSICVLLFTYRRCFKFFLFGPICMWFVGATDTISFKHVHKFVVFA